MHILEIIIGLVIWSVLGVWRLRHIDTPLLMMSDKRSCHYNWLALPAMYLTILLWPIGWHVSWWCFDAARRIPYKKKQVQEDVFSKTGYRNWDIESPYFEFVPATSSKENEIIARNFDFYRDHPEHLKDFDISKLYPTKIIPYVGEADINPMYQRTLSEKAMADMLSKKVQIDHIGSLDANKDAKRIPPDYRTENDDTPHE